MQDDILLCTFREHSARVLRGISDGEGYNVGSCGGYVEIYPDGHAAKFLFIWLFQIWINTFQRYKEL